MGYRFTYGYVFTLLRLGKFVIVCLLDCTLQNIFLTALQFVESHHIISRVSPCDVKEALNK